MSCDEAPSWPVKTLVPGRGGLQLAEAELAALGSNLEAERLSATPVLAAEGDRWPSTVRDVVAVDEMLLASDARLSELEVSEEGWNKMVSKPGFFFFLPSQLSRML